MVTKLNSDVWPSVFSKKSSLHNDKNIYHTRRVFPRYVLIYVYAYLAPLFHKLYKFLHELDVPSLDGILMQLLGGILMDNLDTV